MKTRPATRLFRRFARDNKAVSALEYAILVGVITAGIGAAVVAFQTQLVNAISTIGGNVTTGHTGTGTPTQ